MSDGGTPAARRQVAAPCPACGGRGFRHLFHKQGYGFVRCAGCGLVRLDPLPDPATLPDVYDRSYENGLYAAFARAEAVREATARARVAALRAHARESPWLDVGASTGALVRAARAAGIDAEGIELSAPAVAAARAAGLPVTRASAEHFAPTRRYGCVTAFDLLEHLVDPAGFLARVRAWLAPGGRLALSVPDISSAAARLMGRHWYYYAPPLHVYYFDRRTLVRLLARHGFRTVHVGPAPKVLTPDYALELLATFNPWLHHAGRVLSAVLPRTLRTRPVRVPVGELLLVAEPDDTLDREAEPPEGCSRSL